MSPPCSVQVRKVVRGMVNKVAKEFEEHDKLLAAENKSADAVGQQGDEDMRRPVRARKEPDRLAATAAAPKQPREKKNKEGPIVPEMEMTPPPPDLRGILKRRGSAPYPPPRKSSLSAATGKSIVKKYRKVRVNRKLHFKVIQPLPGWRPDRTRMPEDEPDEEERQRLEEKEKMEAEEMQKKLRKRKSVAHSTLAAHSSVSDDGRMGAEEQPSSSAGVCATPASPDVFYEAYMKETSPDSVLATDNEEEEMRRHHVPKCLFPSIKEGSNEDERRIEGTVFVADTVPVPGHKDEDTVPKRRRSVRIMERDVRRSMFLNQDANKETKPRSEPPPEEDKQKAAEKKERRKSTMFPVTPMKDSPLPKEKAKPAEKSEKTVRRRSGVIRNVPVVQQKEEKKVDKDQKKATARNPWNDDPCRTEEEKAPLMEASIARKTKKNQAVPKVTKRKSVVRQVLKNDDANEMMRVSDWMLGGGCAETTASTAAAVAAGGGGGDGAKGGGKEQDGEVPPEDHPTTSRSEELIESVRGVDSCESLFGAKSNCDTRLVETAVKPEKTTHRKGRRSAKMLKEDMACGSASTSKSRSERDEKKKDEQKLHPFFAKSAAAKPAETATTVPATVLPEKKANRRRSMFQPKKPATAAAKKEEKEQKEEDDDEDEIEVIGEVTNKKKEKEEEAEDSSSHSGNNSKTAPAATSSFWRSSEIDAAPYAGLVHVGRDDVVDESEESGEEGEAIVKKMRRLSVKLPTLSSYAIPSSMRGRTTSESEMAAVFEEKREKNGRSDRAALLMDRARGLAATAAEGGGCWMEAMRPRRVDECIGDKEVLASGKRWLLKWKKRLDAVCEEEEKATKGPKAKKKRKTRGGRYSDESEQEDSDSDYEVCDEERRLPNPLVLSGPVGCGKTAYIRALTEEVGFSLLESAPDERRAGSSLRAKLAGAVDNHRMSSKPSGGLASFFAPKNGNEQKKRKEEREERGRRVHTMVVIEHVDVVFTEEDKLFWPALAEILATTKIPIVITCNVVPDELQRVLRQTEETGGEVMEMNMERGGEGGNREVEEYVKATLAGSTGRVPSSTVISAIVARSRGDLRATLHDAHWATAAAATLNKTDLADKSMRRVDEPAVCDTVASQSFAWSDECARRTDAISSSELSNAGAWPARCGMPGEVYARLCTQIDKIDEDEWRVATARAERMMEMARSGLGAGSGGRSGLLTRREIAMDWMPILEQIDRREQEKKRVYGRRHQHYFNVIKDLNTGLSIDPLDRIQASCAFFRLPQSHDDPQ